MKTALICNQMRENAYGSDRWRNLNHTARQLTQLTLYPVITNRPHPLEGISNMPPGLLKCGGRNICENNSFSLNPAPDATLRPHEVAYRMRFLDKLASLCYARDFVDFNQDYAFFECLSDAFEIAKRVDAMEKSTFYADAQANLLLRIHAVDDIPSETIAKFCNLFKKQGADFNATHIEEFISTQGEVYIDNLIRSPCGTQAVSLFPSAMVLIWLKRVGMDMDGEGLCPSILCKSDNTTVACLLAAAGEKRTRFIDETDEERQTALHYAAFHGVQSVFTALLQNGADLDCQDTQGLTPRQLASKHEKLQPFI